MARRGNAALNIRMTDADREKLATLQAHYGLASMAETIRRCLDTAIRVREAEQKAIASVGRKAIRKKSESTS